MDNKGVRGIVFLGAIALIGIILTQTYLVTKTWSLEQEKFEEKVRIALLNVAKGLADLNDYPLPAQNLVNQLESNYFVVNINNIIDANNLEYYLQKELEGVALDHDFEYGIYDCADQEMVYGKYISYPGNQEALQNKPVDLPTYDEFEYYFGVRFPERTSILLGNMSLSIIFSGILLLTMLFFIYAIFVILRQQALSEMQKDFINNMTHEFKTPISTIKIASEVFLKNEAIREEPRLNKYAHVIKDQNQRLNNQVEKVLQIAKIERESLQLKKEQLDLNEIIKQVVRSVELSIQSLQGSLKEDLCEGSFIIMADKVHLVNILHNLMDNSMKYCRETPQIQITTRKNQDKKWLEFADQGIGISKEHQKKVFKKFYRVPTGDIHNVKGFGLGLFYVMQLCKAHDWKLRLDSKLDQGTTIRIYF